MAIQAGKAKAKPVVLASVVASVLLGACSSETVESEIVKTEGIWAGIDLVADGQSTDVNVEFNVGGRNGTNLVLSSGDSVSVVAGDEEIVLQKDNDVFDVDYEGRIQSSISWQQFVVSLNRSSDTSAPNSVVNLPPNFDITFPGNNTTYTEIQPIDILWQESQAQRLTSKNTALLSPPPPSISLSMTADCVDAEGQTIQFSHQEDIDDSGEYTSDFLSSIQGVDLSKGCDLQIMMEREFGGELDPAFEEGGYIRAKQRRRVTELRLEV